MTDAPNLNPTETEGSNSPFVRRMIDSHSVLGLAFAALIYIVSLSGALTLFVAEISLWETPDVPASYQTSPAAVSAAAKNAEAQLKPGHEILNIIAYAPDEFKPYLTVRLNERKDQKSDLISTDWVADPATGALGQEVKAPFAHVIEDLHTMLHLPRPWGRYLVGLLGVVMFTLILSGIFAHPTIFKDAFKMRMKRNARIAWTDVHNRLSVWGLPFHLIITFTGAFLGVAGITVAALAMVAFEGDQEAAIQVIQGPQAIENAPPMTTSPDYEKMLVRSQGEGRTFSLLVAGNPKSSGETTTIAFYEDGILSARTSEIYRNDGAFLEKLGGSGSPAGARAFGMVQPLHYGTFGGYPIKIFYFVLSLALTYITSTGMMIWFKRKMQQGQPKPNSEAAWRGMTTGLSLGLAGTALFVAANITVPLEVVFFAIWAAGLAAIYFAKQPLKMVRHQYLLIALLLALTALLHFPSALTSEAAAQGILIAINISLLVASFAFAFVSSRGRKREVDQAMETVPAE
ncbi:PepSY-associated TM helix domain-containing protein [Parasphingorhabdus litoris]|uniref:PepSY-associated TM helix domain-containing protein n=1 Tax=Parasphingorhabdus litoris TaxID=394733 RepID=A0ABP3KXS9_9SPHN|nr:PepSY-associated TM helix domain-containing protein [Parasphingorhabdus litoris]